MAPGGLAEVQGCMLAGVPATAEGARFAAPSRAAPKRRTCRRVHVSRRLSRAARVHLTRIKDPRTSCSNNGLANRRGWSQREFHWAAYWIVAGVGERTSTGATVTGSMLIWRDHGFHLSQQAAAGYAAACAAKAHHAGLAGGFFLALEDIAACRCVRFEAGARVVEHAALLVCLRIAGFPETACRGPAGSCPSCRP